MKIWLIVVLFFASLFVDGIVFPALFGFQEGFLTIIFFVGMLLYREADFSSLFLGLIFSGLAEFYWGLKMGSLMLSLLASAGVFFLLNKFLNIRSRVLLIILGVVMFIVFWETSALVTKIL